MPIQVGFNRTVPTVIADSSNLPPGPPVLRDAQLCRQAGLGGKQIANHATNARTNNVPRTTRNFLAAAGLVLGLCTFGPLASAGTAAADGPDVTPMPPAVIDEDGFQNYDTSSYPASPSWPAPPSWGSYPAAPSWPGISSHPCCSR
jgi:hypothetical protein